MNKNKINILLVASNLGLGGVGRHLSYLFRYMNKDRFQWYVITLKKRGPLLKVVENENIPIFDLDLDKVYTPKAILKAIRLRKFVQKYNIHIIKAYNYKESIFAFFLALACRNTCLITGRRDTNLNDSLIYAPIYKVLNTRTTAVVANSGIVRKLSIDKEKINPQKIVKIYNGVDLTKYRFDFEKRKKIRAEFQIRDNHLVIGSVANIKPTKGYPDLLVGFHQIVNEYPNTKLMITGKVLRESPHLKERLDQIIKNFNLEDKVIFTGQREDIECILNALDIYVLFSSNEGFSNSLLEAMSCGLPVIATNVGGNSEVIDNMKDGIIVEKGDVSNLVNSLKYLINNRIEAAKMGEFAQKKVQERFSVEKMVNDWSNFYEKIFGNYFKINIK